LSALIAMRPYPSAMTQQSAVVSERSQTASYTLHMSKSEVVVDVIALDAQNRPVLNLVPTDLNVFDESDRSQKSPKAISSLRIVDPSSTPSSSELPQTDVLGIAHGTCMLAYTVHYQVAYDPGPDGSVPGIHTVKVQANRRGVKLFYRHGYLIDPNSESSVQKTAIPPPVVATANSIEVPINATVQVGREATLIPLGSNSFGSATPSATSLCADVYEIPETTKRVPDFRHLTPVGVVYTDFLSVSRLANVMGMGLPGVTTRTEWIGLDYYGSFWITRPGTYEFQMISDDGALLEIDGKHIIDLDGLHPGIAKSGEVNLKAGPHTMHIPYFQGPVPSAALALWVKAPNEAMMIFNMRNFTRHSAGDH
jgi:hypothetical protein